jgi:hypothetical protein
MPTDPEAIRLLRHIRKCVVLIACSCVVGMLLALFPEYTRAAIQIGALVLIGVLIAALVLATLAGAFARAASGPTPPTVESDGASTRRP